MPYVTQAVRKRRQELGMTPQELAAKIGRSVSHLNNAEGGRKPIRIECLAKIARALGMPLSEAIDDTSEADAA